MKCTSRSITLLASLTLLLAEDVPRDCFSVAGPRIHASDLGQFLPAFRGIPGDVDFGPAPLGGVARQFRADQFRAYFPSGFPSELPSRFCVARQRREIPLLVWQSAVDRVLKESCGTTGWRAKVTEWPQHLYPEGTVLFAQRPSSPAQNSIQFWRGQLLLPDKSTIAVWARVALEIELPGWIAQRDLHPGETIQLQDLQKQSRWVAGNCGSNRKGDLVTEGPRIVRRHIGAGGSVTTDDLLPVPVVRRGDEVSVEAVTGDAVLRIPATAEGNAQLGEKVSVRSHWNGVRLTGRAIGPGKVRLP